MSFKSDRSLPSVDLDQHIAIDIFKVCSALLLPQNRSCVLGTSVKWSAGGPSSNLKYFGPRRRRSTYHTHSIIEMIMGTKIKRFRVDQALPKEISS